MEESLPMTEIEIRVVQGEDYDAWYTFPEVPREGDFFNLGDKGIFKVAEVHWMPMGTQEVPASHVVVFLETPKGPGPGKDKRPHPWKK
jgi:hypothetical protein